jgi:hypothetical protein
MLFIDYCSIVLIGTEQILDTIFNKRKNNQSVPQLWRRFKAGTRVLLRLTKPGTSHHFTISTFLVQRICRILNELCENYGELHDYLEPFLRWSSETSKPVNEQISGSFIKYQRAGIPGATS